MARTRLFGKLRRIAARALASRPNLVAQVDAEKSLLTRRQLTLAGAHLAVSSALAACGNDHAGKRPSDVRVAVVGAGIAGLHRAYRLQQSGIDGRGRRSRRPRIRRARQHDALRLARRARATG
jgi:hypothetical protein